MIGKYVGYVAGDDRLHGFLSGILRDQMGVRESRPGVSRLPPSAAATRYTPTRRSTAGPG